MGITLTTKEAAAAVKFADKMSKAKNHDELELNITIEILDSWALCDELEVK